MTVGAAPQSPAPEGGIPSVAARLAGYQRVGGIITPVLTAVFAFLVGGLVVAATGKNPFSTYKAIFDGTGLNLFFEIEPLPLASRDLRARLESGDSIRDVIPEDVYRIIEREGLYGPHVSGTLKGS